MSNYGYARVSAKSQNLDRQLEAFEKCDIPAGNIYYEKQSGKNFERKEYRKLMRRLRSGDVLWITELDRLGRDYKEIMQQWEYITKKKGSDIVVINMPLLDTRRAQDLLRTFIIEKPLSFRNHIII